MFFKSKLNTKILLHKSKRLFIVVLCICGLSAFAHGNLSIQIKEKTNEIAKSPNNAKLYYERGFLYQEHLEFENAITDYLKSIKLGYSDKEATFKLAEANYEAYHFEEALSYADSYLALDSLDVRIYKLRAQILFNLLEYKDAINSYNYFITKAIDIRPEDVVEYSKIILAETPDDYTKALEVINLGLNIIGENTFSLQLKKLEYLENSNQTSLAINQYNYFILNNNRKEFWYFKKATYLLENNQIEQAKIALQQSRVAIQMLQPKFKNTVSIKDLTTQITQLDKIISHEY
ncbi:tetratricopeptide repeat protein [Xanthomarina spongicola]|uniref:Uncharacterized protein n=1 Tax=Xanthomarina spongicola TaxID=570520 RepID=A0A316DJZ2_9FLAO|nr:hypothetical protein [Xanthomarina spongicola]PWK17986.1 hypothetical protein LX78_02385 [Xanthomarina spongicola]